MVLDQYRAINQPKNQTYDQQCKEVEDKVQRRQNSISKFATYHDLLANSMELDEKLINNTLHPDP